MVIVVQNMLRPLRIASQVGHSIAEIAKETD